MNDDVEAAAAVMVEHGISALPVVAGGRVIGLVSEIALLRCLASPAAPVANRAATGTGSPA